MLSIIIMTSVEQYNNHALLIHIPRSREICLVHSCNVVYLLYLMYNTTGIGTFGRVILVCNLPTKKYYALKVMKISEVIKLQQVEHVNSEKEILASISHPFIVKL